MNQHRFHSPFRKLFPSDISPPPPPTTRVIPNALRRIVSEKRFDFPSVQFLTSSIQSSSSLVLAPLSHNHHNTSHQHASKSPEDRQGKSMTTTATTFIPSHESKSTSLSQKEDTYTPQSAFRFHLQSIAQTNSTALQLFAKHLQSPKRRIVHPPLKTNRISPSSSKHAQSLQEDSTHAVSPNQRILQHPQSFYLNSSKSPKKIAHIPTQELSTYLVSPFNASSSTQQPSQSQITFLEKNTTINSKLTAAEIDLRIASISKKNVSKLFNTIAATAIPRQLQLLNSPKRLPNHDSSHANISIPLEQLNQEPLIPPIVNLQQPPKEQQQPQQQSIHYHIEDSIRESGEITTNADDKFELIRSFPVASHIMVIRVKQDESEATSPFSKQKAQSPPPRKLSQFSSVKEIMSIDPKKRNVIQSPTGQSGSIVQIDSQLHSPRSPMSTLIQKTSAITLKQTSKHNSPRNSVQGKFLTKMTNRMAAFFKGEKTLLPLLTTTNQQLYRDFTYACRSLKRNIDSLFAIESNFSKNLRLLVKLFQAKQYLMDELINAQFSLIHSTVIESLENYIITEQFLKKYFQKSDELCYIVSDIYIKDLSYINAQLERHLNSSHITAASKISQSIQAEYKLVKKKEKSIILDHLQNASSSISASTQTTRMHKQQYPFFQGYLYNIQPHRNPYSEIQNLERTLGPCVHLNQVEREVFQNLEKSYEQIRANNQP